MMAKNYKDKSAETVKLRFGDRKFDGNVFTTRMDPSSQSTQYPVHYPILAESHRPMIDVKYDDPNTDADNTPGIASLKRDGPLYNSIDLVKHPIAFQYLGLATSDLELDPGSDQDPDPLNIEYNEQFRDQLIEALSAGYATQLTEIAFLKAYYETGIPAMKTGKGAKIGALVFYQSVVQNLAIIMAKYNTLLSVCDHLVNMGYNAEGAETIERLNMFKKATTFSIMEQVGELLSQEYFDLKWFREISVISTVPTRKFNDMLSPLTSILGMHKVPEFRFAYEEPAEGESPEWVFNTNDSYWNDIIVIFNEGAVVHHYTFEGLVHHILDLLDPVSIVAASRSYYNNTADTVNAIYWINDFTACMRKLLATYSKFTAAMSDLKTFLMLLQDRTSLNRWVLGSTYTKPSRPRTQIEPVDYVLVDDILKATFTGGADIAIDQNTRKWKVTSLWDYNEGIPRFDYYEGGFAVAVSVRDKPLRSEYGSEFNPMFFFPIPFNRIRIGVWTKVSDTWSKTNHTYDTIAFDRKGRKYSITRVVMGESLIKQSYSCARLRLTGMPVGAIVMPRITAESYISADDAPMVSSNMLRFLLGYFGCAYSTVDNENTVTKTYDVPQANIIGLVSRQFGQFPGNAMDYLRSSAPLRITDGNATLGFSMH